jgi:hypothetical protein
MCVLRPARHVAVLCVMFLPLSVEAAATADVRRIGQ